MTVDGSSALYAQGCEAVTSCREPDATDPCYSAHDCELMDGHEGAHFNEAHGGMEWTSGWVAPEQDPGPGEPVEW